MSKQVNKPTKILPTSSLFFKLYNIGKSNIIFNMLIERYLFNVSQGYWSENKNIMLLKGLTPAAAAAAAAKSLQSCPTLCDPIDGSPPGSPVLGIFQARALEWVAISFSNAWKWKVKMKSLSRVQLLATPWTAAHQVPLSMGFSRQEYSSEVPLPSLGLTPSR